ncbi:hypothetical protein [Kribbella soli]|nr:hypothetical protein [Kribbella soli]
MTTPRLRFDRSRLAILAQAECRRMLRSVALGRLVYTAGVCPRSGW